MTAGLFGSAAPLFVDPALLELVTFPCMVAFAAGVILAVARLLDVRSNVPAVGAALVGAVAFGSALIAHPKLLWAYEYPADAVHFLKELPNYQRAVEALPDDGKRYREFNWGGMLFASRGVVYDETDEIARPPGRQSAAWLARLNNSDLACGLDPDVRIGIVEPLAGHYYLASFGC